VDGQIKRSFSSKEDAATAAVTNGRFYDRSATNSDGNGDDTRNGNGDDSRSSKPSNESRSR
jgi:hypothetical protein